jgi:hypothetical protein
MIALSVVPAPVAARFPCVTAIDGNRVGVFHRRAWSIQDRSRGLDDWALERVPVAN